MRSVSRGVGTAAGKLAAAILWAALALPPLPARAGQAPSMPLVLPQQCLSSLPQLNGSTGFNVVCLSQAPNPDTGAMEQTAVVDLSPPGGSIGPDGSFPLFIFPQDVPAVQQLNGGMQISPVGIFQMPAGGGGTATQVAQVNVAGPGALHGMTGSGGCLLVCPVPSLPLLGQLNPNLSFQVLCTSPVGGGKTGPSTQTALLNIQPAHGILSPSQSLSMLVPVGMLPTLGQLNVGTSIDVINVIETPAGGSSAILPVALIDVTQGGQALAPSSNLQTNPNDSSPGNDPGQGNGNGKDNGSGRGNGNGKGKGKGGD